MMSPSVGMGSAADTEISREDQMKINRFSKMNMKFHMLRQEIKGLKDDLQNLQDAGDAIDEAGMDDKKMKLFVGECLVTVDEDAAKNY